MTRPEVAAPGAPRWLGAAALPECLGELSRPPAGLWLLGNGETLVGAPKRHVAIVGTRDASRYGERTAANLAAACARAGIVVVSGLARGVDAAAHRAALEAQGETIAVQGTGVDVPYPVGHRALHREIARRGAVLSEMEPGATASPGCFPRRNRLIAALSEVTVVVEAGFKSGAINTATQALELGRTVAAVPGPIDEPRSAGCNLLIRDGAQVVTCVEDLLTLLGLPTRTNKRIPSQGIGPVNPGSPNLDGESILAHLAQEPISADDLAARLGMPLQQLFVRLIELEVSGLVERSGTRFRESPVRAG